MIPTQVPPRKDRGSGDGITFNQIDHVPITKRNVIQHPRRKIISGHNMVHEIETNQLRKFDIWLPKSYINIWIIQGKTRLMIRFHSPESHGKVVDYTWQLKHIIKTTAEELVGHESWSWSRHRGIESSFVKAFEVSFPSTLQRPGTDCSSTVLHQEIEFKPSVYSWTIFKVIEGIFNALSAVWLSLQIVMRLPSTVRQSSRWLSLRSYILQHEKLLYIASKEKHIFRFYSRCRTRGISNVKKHSSLQCG